MIKQCRLHQAMREYNIRTGPLIFKVPEKKLILVFLVHILK